MSVVWSIFDTHDVSGVNATAVFRSLIVNILTAVLLFFISDIIAIRVVHTLLL
jgi:hypothetical protein